MTAMMLDLQRIQYLADTAGYPPISDHQARQFVDIVAGEADPADDDNDPTWDLAWAVSSYLLERLSPDLADDMMEIGWIAEKLYPICEEATAAAGEVA